MNVARRSRTVASAPPVVNNGKLRSFHELEGGSVLIWSPLLARSQARITRLRLYPDDSMGSFYEIPVDRARAVSGALRFYLYDIPLTESDLTVKTFDPTRG
jgi:hypothetical protein